MASQVSRATSQVRKGSSCQLPLAGTLSFFNGSYVLSYPLHAATFIISGHHHRNVASCLQLPAKIMNFAVPMVATTSTVQCEIPMQILLELAFPSIGTTCGMTTPTFICKQLHHDSQVSIVEPGEQQSRVLNIYKEQSSGKFIERCVHTVDPH